LSKVGCEEQGGWYHNSVKTSIFKILLILFPTLKEMKQWEKWKCLWMVMAIAQLVEMVLDSYYKPPAGEGKLYS
jgi:hypothetical protein